jgi:hypothetical protein
MDVQAHLGHEIYLCTPADPEAPTHAPYDFTAELRSASGRHVP